MNSAIAPQKLGLLLFFFIFLFLFQERRSSQPFLFLFFFGAEGRVRIGGPAGISLPLGECSVAIGLLLIICVFTWICGVTDGILLQDGAGWADISLVLLVNDPLVLLQLFVAYRIKRILSGRMSISHLASFFPTNTIKNFRFRTRMHS